MSGPCAAPQGVQELLILPGLKGCRKRLCLVRLPGIELRVIQRLLQERITLCQLCLQAQLLGLEGLRLRAQPAQLTLC